MVGPLVRPGTDGRSQCAQHRRSTAERGQEDIHDLLTRLAALKGRPRAPEELPPEGLRHMAHIVAAETAKFIRSGSVQSESRVYLVHLRNLNTTLHYILPDSLCPVCGLMPDDTPEAPLYP
ncbi:TOMM precursor leader peptide-binding protein [Paenibacillus sp. P26]|nr:TOMM precursor leader peptide-binding protein [Paenibacillus sp. P26]